MNNKITDKITQGMYVLTTNNSGCIIDTVSQVSMGDMPLISIAVNKNNYTNKMINENKKFALSILSENVDGDVIETFGMHTSRNYNKFDKFKMLDVNGIKILEDCIAYMCCEVVDVIDADTHTIFIGKVVKSKLNNDERPMSYGYYQENKETLVKKISNQGKTAWVCTICGYVYYGEELPEGFICPVCGVTKEFFVKK